MKKYSALYILISLVLIITPAHFTTADETDFYKLTKGDCIEKEHVKIALSDIGYELMKRIIKDHEINYLRKNINK